MDLTPLFNSSEEVPTPENASFEGNIPSWLIGSFLQIGPGLFDLSPTYSVNHFLDGYGILSKFSISPRSPSFENEDVKTKTTSYNTVSFSSHYIHSDAYKKAMKTGQSQYTEFGTPSQASTQERGLFSKILTSINSIEELSDNASASLFQIGDRCCVAAPTSFFFNLNLDGYSNPTGERFNGKKVLGQNGLGSHPLVDEDGTWFNMGFTVLPSLKHNILAVPGAGHNSVGVDLENFFKKAKAVASIPSRWNSALALNHSFGMSKSFIIFVEQPLVVRVSRVLSTEFKGYAVKDWLEWRPEDKNKFHLVHKATGKKALMNLNILSEEPFFFMHVLNCYEDEINGRIIIDIATSPNPAATEATSLEKLRRNNLSSDLGLDVRIQRFVIPLKELSQCANFKTISENYNILESHSKWPSAYRKGANTLVLRPANLTPSGVDQMNLNPNWVGRKHAYAYGSGSFLSRFLSAEETPFANSVVKINADSGNVVARWFQSLGHFPGEPLFVPNPVQAGETKEEDDGVILIAVRTLPSGNEELHDFLLVLDAKSFHEVGRAYFKSRFPAALHGIFIRND